MAALRETVDDWLKRPVGRTDSGLEWVPRRGWRSASMLALVVPTGADGRRRDASSRRAPVTLGYRARKVRSPVHAPAPRLGRIKNLHCAMQTDHLAPGAGSAWLKVRPCVVNAAIQRRTRLRSVLPPSLQAIRSLRRSLDGGSRCRCLPPLPGRGATQPGQLVV